jgi:hypothetical protein
MSDLIKNLNYYLRRMATGIKNNFGSMEEDLAREMHRLKVSNQKASVEVNRICAESDELKEIQDRIKAAYLNKERSA